MQNNFQPEFRRKRKVKIKYKNIVIALIILLLLIFGISSCTSLLFKKSDNNDNKSQIESSQSKQSSEEESSKQSGQSSESANASSKMESSTSKTDDPAPEDILKNSAFIGDSRMKGLVLYNGLSTIKDYTSIGLNAQTALSKSFIPTAEEKTLTIEEALSTVGKLDRIYISLGINELAWPSVDGFIGEYTKLLNMVKSKQPESTIYIMAILPVTQQRSDTDASFNNSKIKIYNDELKKMSETFGVKFLDCSSAVANDKGVLPDEASEDGIHLTKPYCVKWLQYIKENP